LRRQRSRIKTRYGFPWRRSGGRWAKIYEHLSEEGYGQAGAVTDRAEAQVLRLSLLYALADGSETVGVPHLTAALALWRYCEASAYRLFGSRAADPKAQKILDALRQAAGGLSRTEVNAQVFNRNESAEAIHQALKRLRAAGFVHSSPEETGGRTAERWFCTKNGYELNE
jgi:DNA-binding transcriptional ArsR family regulator